MPENSNQQGQQADQPGATPEANIEDAAAERLLAQWAADGDDGGDKGKGGKDAVLADLAKERKARQTLSDQLAELKKSQDGQRDALAKALGVKPEDTSDMDKLTSQFSSLQQQFADSQRKATLLELAATPGEDADGKQLPSIPKEYHHLLTATETEALQAQAKTVAALVAAQQGATGPPGFAPPAGQGQGNTGKTPTLNDQVAAAEREAANKTPGSPDQKAAQQRVMALKSRQLAALKPQ